MAANTAPIFTLTPSVSANNGTTLPAHVITATGDYTGASANHVLVHTAGANGSFLQKIRAVAEGTNTASVLRIYINNGSDPTSAANNILYGQVSLPGTTATDIAGTQEIDYPINIAIPASFRVYVGVGTTVAAGWRVTCVAGAY